MRVTSIGDLLRLTCLPLAISFPSSSVVSINRIDDSGCVRVDSRVEEKSNRSMLCVG